MKVLVTGAAGFIGSNLVYYLIEERPSWRIFALDALTYAGNLKNLAPLLDDKKITFHKLDITDRDSVQKVFADEQFDLVFHLAAESHVDRSIHSAEQFVRTNVLGTLNLLESALNSNCGKFIHVSTDEVYGSLGPTGRFVETTPLDPTSPYSASKAASDLIALAFFKTHGLKVTVTRCTNNYGPYQFPEKLIPLFITNALQDKSLPLYGDGMNIRSWLYVKDHCDALLKVAEKGDAGEIYNIGGSEEAEIPNKVVTETILDILEKPHSLIKPVADRPAHDRRYAVDYSKINLSLYWTPRTSFFNGIEQTVRWYKTNREWWEEIKTGAYLEFYKKQYGDR